MENTVKATEVKTSEMNKEEVEQMLKALSAQSERPRGTVDEIFNLGVKAERQRQNIINGSKFLKQMRKEQKKKEKEQKDPLDVRILRKLGLQKIEKPKKEEPKEETKK